MRFSEDLLQPLPVDGPPPLGVTWYENEPQWLRFRSTATDPNNFFDTYAEWVASAEKQIAELRRAGIVVIKVPLSCDDFTIWCRQNGVTNCRRIRAVYVTVVMAERALWKQKATADC